MALTRAQLLMGNQSQGDILTGQPQGVRPGGAGIDIALDGVISVDSQTIIGVMKMGQTPATAAAAYNGYTWPTSAGLPGQQLETNGAGILTWADSDGIDWTQKGQLIAATGPSPAPDTLVNVGATRSFLVADPATASGLAYTDSITSAVTVPSGTDIEKPALAVAGDFRLNTDTGKLEFYTGGLWEEVASGNPVPGGNTFVKETIPLSPAQTGNALIPVGTTAERQTAPASVAGSFRYNSDFTQLEVFDGINWLQIPAANTDFVAQTRPAAGKTASAVIPRGTTAEEEVGALGGYLRYNTDYDELQFFNGTNWDLIAPTDGAVSSFVQAGTPTARNVGDLWYNTNLQRESVWDGVAWVQPGVSQSSPTGFATLPVGTTGQRGAPVDGGLRFNSDNDKLEFWNGSAWVQVASGDPTPGGNTFVEQTVPTTGTPSAVIPTGNTVGRQTAPLPNQGYTRFNTDTTLMEVFDGTIWVPIGAPPNAGLGLDLSGVVPNQILKAKTPVAATPPTPGTLAAQAIDGSLYWDVDYGALFIRYADVDSTQWVMINGNNVQTGALDFPAGPGPGATYAAPNGLTYTYDGTKGVWTCPAGAQLGLGLTLSGQFTKVSIPTASAPPGAGAAQAQAVPGSLYWDDVLSQLFIYYNNGGTPAWVQAAPSAGSIGVTNVSGTLPIVVASGSTAPVVSINAATTAAQGSVQIGTNIDVAAGVISVKNASTADKGVIEIATGAEAAAGTDATLSLTPATGVPKTPADMTGAALIPGGGNGARPAPVTGMLRYNNQGGTPVRMEYHDGVNWTALATSGVQAWVNFNGAGGAIRASGNVASVTVLGTGIYTVNFTTALASADYASVISTSTSAGWPENIYGTIAANKSTNSIVAPTTAGITVSVTASNISAPRDVPYVSMMFVL